jgi:hypothetical protein
MIWWRIALGMVLVGSGLTLFLAIPLAPAEVRYFSFSNFVISVGALIAFGGAAVIISAFPERRNGIARYRAGKQTRI